MVSKIFAWSKKHWFLTFLIFVFIIIPFLSGLISAFTKTSSNGSGLSNHPGAVTTLTLTERLTNINNDPYWTSKGASEYSSNVEIQIQSVLFSTYADEVKEGEASTLDVDKKLALELKKKLIAKQIIEYPKMRKAYADIADRAFWEKDIDVSVSDVGNTSITFVGAVFASNKGIAAVESPIESMLKELRFKRVNYKWIKHDDDYQYFELKTLNDSELKSS